MRSSRGAALLAAAVSFAAVSAAHAHAPLPRDLALAPGESGALTVRMPGFGFLVRTRADAPFAYACDALLAVSPLEERVPMAYRADGALLVGTALGLRVLDADGCPGADALLAGPVVALAVHPLEPDRAYAVTALPDGAPRVHRSLDGGESWSPAALLVAHPVTGLVLDASDPEQLYVSQRVANDQTSIAVSKDGGASFERFERATALDLLYVHPVTKQVFGREPHGGPVGVDIVRTPDLAEPWEQLLTVNFFGGFVAVPSDPDTIFVGDEARGIFRSGTAGDRIEETLPDIASSGLAFGAGGLWSTTAGLPHQPALVRSSDGIAAVETVMAFTDVTRLVECASIDVEEICAGAWIEWERDVLGALPVLDAAVDDSGMADPDASAADAGETDAAASSATRSSSGCSAVAPSASNAWLIVLALAVVRAATRRRRLHRSAAPRFDSCLERLRPQP